MRGKLVFFGNESWLRCRSNFAMLRASPTLRFARCKNFHTISKLPARRTFGRPRYQAHPPARSSSHAFSQRVKGPNNPPFRTYVAGAIGTIAIGGVGYSAANTPTETDWDAQTRQYVNEVYGLFGSTVAGAAGVAVLTSRLLPPTFFSSFPLQIGLMLGSSVGIIYCIRSIHYSNNKAEQYSSLAGFTLFEGLFFSYVFHAYPGNLIKSAAMGTGLLTAGLSSVGAVASGPEIIAFHGPLMVGCSGLLFGNIASLFFPIPGWQLVSIYGGLVLYSGRMITDTAITVKHAKAASATNGHFNAASHAMGIYLDAAIIFMKLLQLLSRLSNNGSRHHFVANDDEATEGSSRLPQSMAELDYRIRQTQMELERLRGRD